MRSRIVALLVLAVASITLGVGGAHAQLPAPCGPAAAACLDLTTQQAWLMNHGVVTYGPTPVTTGRRGHETPPGVFHVTFKNAHFWSTIFKAPMPYAVFFNGGMAFHEGSLSVPSHGCVHLSHDAAITFFTTLNRGDVVQVVS